MFMKKLLFASILIAVVSCSSNDTTPTPTPTPVDPTGNSIVTTYLPITTNNQWTYATQTTQVTPAPTTGTGITTGIDVLKVDSEVVENSITYKLMKTTATPKGFYSSTMNNNKVRVDGSSIKLTGNISFLLGTNTLNFAVTDFVIFKENAVSGNNLGTPTTGTTTLQIPVPALNTTKEVIVDYIITAVAGGDSSPITIGTNVYNDVKKVILYVNIKAKSNPLGTGDIQIFTPTNQDVIISTQYYSKNNGMVKADTKIEYLINPTVTGLVPSIVNGLQNGTENLTAKNF
jgi:hypothetical protein